MHADGQSMGRPFAALRLAFTPWITPPDQCVSKGTPRTGPDFGCVYVVIRRLPPHRRAKVFIVEVLGILIASSARLRLIKNSGGWGWWGGGAVLGVEVK